MAKSFGLPPRCKFVRSRKSWRARTSGVALDNSSIVSRSSRAARSWNGSPVILRTSSNSMAINNQ